MGNFTPVIDKMNPWLGAASLGLGIVQTIQAQQQASAQARAANAAAQQQSDQLRLAKEIEERRRKAALDRALASARAGFAARGLSAGEGSARSLLAGIEADAAADGADRDALFQSRLDSLNAGLQRNLLELGAARRGAQLAMLRRGLDFVDYLGRRRSEF